MQLLNCCDIIQMLSETVTVYSFSVHLIKENVNYQWMKDRKMRERILLDYGWRFHRGDIEIPGAQDKDPMYVQAKTERMRMGPASKTYNDYSGNISGKDMNPIRWETVDLPHDYVVKQIPEEQYNSALGYFKYENAWYRRRFRLSESDRNKRICLYFEGIATHADIYLNGCLMYYSFCGYTPFEVDITDYVLFDNENVIAVYVKTDSHESWWYEGGGIYRHVWLEKTEKTAVDRWGLYMIPEKKTDTGWLLTAENTVRNDSYETAVCEVTTDIIDGETVVCSMKKDSITISARSIQTFRMQSNVENPHLWSLSDTHRYRAVTTVISDGEIKDSYETKFGFRYYEFDRDTGMKLNGVPTFINGVCMHADFGLTGKAVPNNIQKYKIELLHEMGANGFRCSHYPHAEATMDALDEMGFIVMDETRWFESTEEGLEQLRTLIKRDRNRPSVLFWSMGNEEFEFVTDKGRRIASAMKAEIEKYDKTRPVIVAGAFNPKESTVYDVTDAIGVNYNLDKFDKFHEQYPDKPILSSECCATGTTRGWYFDPSPEKGYINALDRYSYGTFFGGREQTWKVLRSRPWIIGGYQWIGIEHRGECMWPRLCSQSGAIDMFLQKKDAFYQNQSMWIEDRPILHLLPHWNFSGMEGEPITVRVYTNCDSVELYVNGISFGKTETEAYTPVDWIVPYEPGEIRCVGYNNGAKVIEETRRTTGKPSVLKLKAENKVTKANSADIVMYSCWCEDENGLEVPDASPVVDFYTNRFGVIVGTGSDVSDHNCVTSTVRKMRAGRISVAVKIRNESGELKLYANAEGIKGAVCTVVLE